MTLFYKKVALACLVSLTANQAMQAIQFPNVWNWMKSHPATSATLVGGIMAAIIVMVRSMRKPKNMQSVLYVPAGKLDGTSKKYPKLGYVMGVGFAKEADGGFKKEFAGVSAALATLTQTPKDFIADDFDARPSLRILTLVDFTHGLKGKVSYDKPAGCIVFAEPVNEDDPIVIEHMAANKIDDQKNMLSQLLANRRDIKLSAYMKDDSGAQRDLIGQQMEAFDGFKPHYENGVFKRYSARVHFKEWTKKEKQAYQDDIKNLEADRKRAADKLAESERERADVNFRQDLHTRTTEWLESKKRKSAEELWAEVQDSLQALVTSSSSPAEQEAA